MNFLADESCDFAVVRELRAPGHDIQAVADIARGAKDADVVRLAREGRRVLLTEDKDFGRIVYAGGQGDIGVVLFRFPSDGSRTPPDSGSGAGRTLWPAALDFIRRGGAR